MTAALGMNPLDPDGFAAGPFHAWWLSEPLRAALRPTRANPDRRRASAGRNARLHRATTALLSVFGLFFGAVSTALLERELAQAAPAAPPSGTAGIGETSVRMSQLPAVAKLTVSQRAVSVEPPFNHGAAARALSTAAASTGACSDGKHWGRAKILVKFSPSGRSTAMVVGGELGRSAVGVCIAEQMEMARIPPFRGKDVIVSKTVQFR